MHDQAAPEAVCTCRGSSAAGTSHRRMPCYSRRDYHQSTGRLCRCAELLCARQCACAGLYCNIVLALTMELWN